MKGYSLVKNIRKNLVSVSGYTLIEILVVIAVTGILFTVGYAGFRDFSRRQILAGAAKKVQGNLRLAQQYALSGQKPDGIYCDAPNTLIGYSFDILLSGSEYKIEAVCTGLGSPFVQNDFIITDSGISIAISKNPIIFKVLGSGTDIPSNLATTITLTQAGTGDTAIIKVDSGGVIQ